MQQTINQSYQDDSIEENTMETDMIQPKFRNTNELTKLEYDNITQNKDKMESILKETTKNVMRYMDIAGVSVDDMSEATGISKGQLYKMRNGRAFLGLRSLIKIGFVLQVPPSTFIPYEKKNVHRKSIGEKVNDMCLYCSPKAKNHILNMIKAQVEYEASLEEDDEKNKRK